MFDEANIIVYGLPSYIINLIRQQNFGILFGKDSNLSKNVSCFGLSNILVLGDSVLMLLLTFIL